MPSVREFRSTKDYERWLAGEGSRVRVLATTSSKRWSPMTGFLGDAKTITVTFEPPDLLPGPSTQPKQMAVVVAPKPTRFLAAPDITKFSNTLARDGETVEIVERRAGYALLRRADRATGWLHPSAVRWHCGPAAGLQARSRCARP